MFEGKITGIITSLVSVSLTEPEFPHQVFIVHVAHERTPPEEALVIQSDDAGVPLHYHIPGLQGARIPSHEIMSYKKDLSLCEIRRCGLTSGEVSRPCVAVL